MKNSGAISGMRSQALGVTSETRGVDRRGLRINRQKIRHLSGIKSRMRVAQNKEAAQHREESRHIALSTNGIS